MGYSPNGKMGEGCMADNGTIQITGLDERIKQLGAMSTKNPEMRRRINEVISKTLAQVRKSLQSEAKTGLGMESDPRHAYKAVRYAVYRRIFGGQVNILQSRNAGKGHLYEPPRKGTKDPHGRGGNRVPRSRRTKDLMSYEGKDRGFVLRFLNQGTADRSIHSMGSVSLRSGNVRNIQTRSIGANRGSITARHWFGSASQKQLEQASQQLDKMIDDIIQGIMY